MKHRYVVETKTEENIAHEEARYQHVVDLSRGLPAGKLQFIRKYAFEYN